MASNRKMRLAVILLLALSIFCIAILLVESQTRVVIHWFDNVVYDNYNHYLPCEQLPAISEVETVLNEHQELIHQIEQVNPGFVGLEVDLPCPGHADLVFWYGSHSDRLIIEEMIGSADFYGVPYRLHNR